jgi:hypothetical protein
MYLPNGEKPVQVSGFNKLFAEKIWQFQKLSTKFVGYLSISCIKQHISTLQNIQLSAVAAPVVCPKAYHPLSLRMGAGPIYTGSFSHYFQPNHSLRSSISIHFNLFHF